MRIHEVELYTSKQIMTFIDYLKVVADEKKAIEDMQSHYQGNNANFITSGACLGQATPEYMAKLRAEADNSAKESTKESPCTI